MSFLQEKGCVPGGSNPRATFLALFLAVLTTEDPTLAVTLSGLAGTQKNDEAARPAILQTLLGRHQGMVQGRRTPAWRLPGVLHTLRGLADPGDRDRHRGFGVRPRSGPRPG